MSQRVFRDEPALSFDQISQSCMMDVEQIDPRLMAARNSAVELLGQATDADAMLFLDEIDDSWLEATVDAENAENAENAAFEGENVENGAQLVQSADLDLDQMQSVPLQQHSNDVKVEIGDVKVDIAGFRELPHPILADAGKGKEKMKSHKNNNWSLRRADKLRAALGWDMSIQFGDLPLTKVDELLANLFSRVVKIKGGEYPAESLMNMLGGYNRLLRRASDLRSLKDPNSIPMGREFDIKKHPAFTRTRLTLEAALKKTARDGTNKKRKKVNHITQVQEEAVLSDVDHQIFHNGGCQKRTAFYLLVRCGIRGGDELWELKRLDLVVKTDKHGREYVQYMERHSKNNDYTLERNKEEQFRLPYHSYEPDFILTTKQYLRHLPPWEEGNKDALFLSCIKNPASIVWYNRAFKVGKGTSVGWLENMLKLVGLPDKLFSNKSGRATLITRLAAQGVPDEVGMLLSGHHTTDGYGRYDRTKELKQEAATMVAHSPGLNYETALAQVSKRFVEEDLLGSDIKLKPLIAHISGGSTSNAIMPCVSEGSCSTIQTAAVQPEVSSSGTTQLQVQAGRLLQNLQNHIPKQIEDRPENINVKVADPPNKLAVWNAHYDGIDWDAAIQSDPKLAMVLGGLPRMGPVAVGSGNTFSNCQNCTIQINLPPAFNPSNFNWAKMMEFNKENHGPQDK